MYRRIIFKVFHEILSFFILLLKTIVGLGQKTADTTVMYNSEMTKKRTEFTAAGRISKETYYYKSGKIQAEYYYLSGKQFHWIGYDQKGNITAEWADTVVERAKFVKLRNLTFLFSGIFLAFLMIILCKINYINTFYSVFLFSITYPFVIMLLEKRIFTYANQIIMFVFLSQLFIFPVILLTLAILNIIQRRKVSLVTSIIAILVSLGFLFFFWVGMSVSGIGILG